MSVPVSTPLRLIRACEKNLGPCDYCAHPAMFLCDWDTGLAGIASWQVRFCFWHRPFSERRLDIPADFIPEHPERLPVKSVALAEAI